jgi:carboxyl-terminal processing protease
MVRSSKIWRRSLVKLKIRLRTILRLALACLVLGAAQPALAQRTNLSFETPSADDPERPRDWKFHGSGYLATLDTSARDGKLSLRLTRTRAGGSAGVSQTVAAKELRATRVRLSGYVRTHEATGGEAGLALLVWGSSQLPLSMETMRGTGATGTQEWTRYEIELPVPREAERVEFGGHFNGAGTVWFDGLELDVITDTAITDSVRAYVERALELMQTHSMRRDSIDWSAFRAEVWEDVRGTSTVPALYAVLKRVVRRLGDGHSLFIRPSTGQGRTFALPGGQLVGERVGYLVVPEFGTADSTRSTAYADSLQRAIRNLDARRVCGWIVDLRGNSGGNMWPMIAGVGPLLGGNPVGWFVRPTGARELWIYERGAGVYQSRPLARTSGIAHVPRDPAAPVAVLTGSRTMSAGEAVAVAFRGRPNSRSFGAATGGMSTANEIFELSDGARLVITTSVYADRTGRRYGAAIPPDVAVSAGAREASTPGDAVAGAARSWVESQPACAR